MAVYLCEETHHLLQLRVSDFVPELFAFALLSFIWKVSSVHHIWDTISHTCRIIWGKFSPDVFLQGPHVWMCDRLISSEIKGYHRVIIFDTTELFNLGWRQHYTYFRTPSCTFANFCKHLAGEEGFEPSPADPESAVLPLDDSPAQKNYSMTPVWQQ